MAINSDAVMAVALFGSTASIVWAVAFAWTRWLVRPRESIATLPEYQEYLETRIARLERAVDAMTGELQRIGVAKRTEGQMLAEQLPLPGPQQRAMGELRKTDTPH
jgi:hypothetical protein